MDDVGECLFLSWPYLAALAGVVGVFVAALALSRQSRSASIADKVANKQIEQMDKAEAPCVLVETKRIDRGSKAIVLLNNGGSPAYQVDVEFVGADEVPVDGGLEGRFPLPQLASGSEYQLNTNAPDQDPGIYTVRVKYKNEAGEVLSGDFPIKLFEY